MSDDDSSYDDISVEDGVEHRVVDLYSDRYEAEIDRDEMFDELDEVDWDDEDEDWNDAEEEEEEPYEYDSDYSSEESE